MQIDKFNLEFSNLNHQIEEKLKKLKSNECDNPRALLDECLEQFNELKEKLDLNGTNLPQYIRKVSQEKINHLMQMINDAKKLIQPKKAFKFNSKNKLKSIRIQTKDEIKNDGNDALDLKQKEEDDLNLIFQFYGLKNRENENLNLESNKVNGKDIQLFNLNSCTIHIYGNPSTVHIINCKDSKMNIGPVSTSVFIDKCTNSEFNLFCQQLRVHNTFDSIFYLHICTRGIIEDSSRLKFGTYRFNYDQLEQDILNSKLNKSINNWDQIEDFNWLVKNEQSPNWELLK